LKPACAVLLEYRGSGLGLLIFTFHGKHFIRRLSWSISSHFGANSLLKCVSQPEIAKNSLKPPFWKAKDHSRSSMLTYLRSSSPVLVMISSMAVPICNHVHVRVRGANSGRITLFKGVLLFLPRSWGPPIVRNMKFFSRNTRYSKLSYGENWKSLFHLVLERYRDVTDRRTDRQNYRS